MIWAVWWVWLMPNASDRAVPAAISRRQFEVSGSRTHRCGTRYASLGGAANACIRSTLRAEGYVRTVDPHHSPGLRCLRSAPPIARAGGTVIGSACLCPAKPPTTFLWSVLAQRA